MSSKGTPLTVEMFHEAIMPRLEEYLDTKTKQISENIEEKITGYHSDVLDVKQEIIIKLDKMQEQMDVMLEQYERTNRRVDKIDQHLGISTLEQ